MLIQLFYNRQFLDLKDGGHVALDWAIKDVFKDDTPVVIILPGLLGLIANIQCLPY